jgi:hypothetical protein
VESYRREALRPQILSNGSETHWTTLRQLEICLRTTKPTSSEQGLGLRLSLPINDSMEVHGTFQPFFSVKERREGCP